MFYAVIFAAPSPHQRISAQQYSASLITPYHNISLDLFASYMPCNRLTYLYKSNYIRSITTRSCMISGPRRNVDEIWTLLGYPAASILPYRRFGTTYRFHLQGVKKTYWLWKMGPIGCPEILYFLTVHLGTIVANEQLYALFQYIYLIHVSTCFEHHSAHHQEIDCINTSSGIRGPTQKKRD